MLTTAKSRSASLTLLGELKDKEREQAFQAAQYPGTRRRMRFVCGLTAPAYLAAVYADSLLLSGDALLELAWARILAAIAAMAAVVYAFRKDGTPARMGMFAAVYMILLILTENLELILKAGVAPLPETPITAFMILLFYLFLPPQIWQPVLVGTLGSAAYLFTLIFLTPASSGHIANTLLVLLLANGFGLYFSLRYGAAQRREYLARAELKTRAETDPLTGIDNRGKIMETAAREFNAAKRYDYPCSLLVLDVDHFKQVNDTYGHAAGDAVLVGLAELCVEQLRNVDFFGRMGGEEFLIIMPHATCDQALVVADRLLEAIRNTPFTVGEDSITVTASIGAADMTHATASLDKLIQTADTALYRAKQLGRDRACETAMESPSAAAQ
jgi:diguanylate cyclase (GGDEF)-like protein